MAAMGGAHPKDLESSSWNNRGVKLLDQKFGLEPGKSNLGPGVSHFLSRSTIRSEYVESQLSQPE
jgi:hypothetical protein